MNDYGLIIMILAPICFALANILVPSRYEQFSKVISLIGTTLTLMISLCYTRSIFRGDSCWIASLNWAWLNDYNIHFAIGLDGLSGVLVLLTNLLSVISVLASWTAIQSRQREFYFYLLMLQAGVIGTFISLDLILFYVFWEMMLIPLYFLIGIFGSGRRIYAAMKFFLYTFAGSVLMLVAILALYFMTGSQTFVVSELVTLSKDLPFSSQMWLFLAFFVAFSIKVPLFPLHTWLPDAHTEAPTAGSVMLAGVLLKTGVYGLMRFAIPLFPLAAAHCAPVIMVLALIAIIYGAWTAFVQTDMKRLVAYSSVSHMGFVVLGLFAFKEIAVTGAAFQMLAHGISTSGLFLCVGYLYERRHTREMSEFGGLAYNMKIYAVLTGLMVLASVGLPSMCGFVGEFLILLGAYQTGAVWAFIGATGVVFSACYLLGMMQKTFFGALENDKNKKLFDLNMREIFTLVILVIAAFWLGLSPNASIRALKPVSESICLITDNGNAS